MRQIAMVVGKVAITAALLYFAIGRANLGLIGDRLGRIDIVWMLAAMIVAVAQVVLISARWQWIAERCDAKLSLERAFRFNLIASFFNQVLPSTVGGDAARIWLLARESKTGWAKATYSVLLDRFIGVLALAVLVAGCLPWSVQLISNPIGRFALFAMGFGSIGATMAFLLLGYLRWKWLQGRAPMRHLMQLSVIARQILFSARAGAAVMVLSLATHVLTAAVAWCSARSVAAPFEFGHALLLVPPVLLIATVPISIAGWGVRESALVLAFTYAGLDQADGLLISVLLGVVMFVVGIIGGLVWLVSATPVKMFALSRPEGSTSAPGQNEFKMR